jgi:hypothetical protein
MHGDDSTAIQGLAFCIDRPSVVHGYKEKTGSGIRYVNDAFQIDGTIASAHLL